MAHSLANRTEGPSIRRILRLTPRRVIILFLLLPWLVSGFSNEMVFRLALAGAYAVAALSAVVLVGWLGQVSLAQGALMGIGAFTAARLATSFGVPFPWGTLVSAAAGALAAMLMGITALRLRGLYLAIATFTFQYAVEESLFQWGPFSGGFNGITVAPLKWGIIDFSVPKLFFYISWITFIGCAALCLNLRNSKTGRAWLAIKEAESAASAVGVPVTRYRLGAFAVSGALAGVGGSLIPWLIGHTDRVEYLFNASVLVLAVAVVGGVTSVWGAAAAAVVFAVVNYVAGNVSFLEGYVNVFSGVLLLATLFFEREGISGRIAHLREQRRHGKTPAIPELSMLSMDGNGDMEHPEGKHPVLVVKGGPPTSPNGDEPPEIAASLLRVDGVTVRFGGVTACEDLSLEIRPGELVGLVGPNGAGKTTLLGTISGFVTPQSGRVWLGDRDVSGLPVHKRAALGMARTFQIQRVIPSFTVLENLLLGGFLQDRSNPIQQALLLPKAVEQSRAVTQRALEVAGLLRLDQVVNVRVSDLPAAVGRLVEVGRALLAGPRLILLDEPASGLDRAARTLLAESLESIKKSGLGILLVEHDFELVSSLSDRVYVLDYGRLVAWGDPREVRTNPRVVQAYLGDRFALATGGVHARS